MSDEPILKNEPTDDWTMPEPVFRSSEGRKPGELPPDPQGDIPTEPGFTDDGAEEDVPSQQNVRARTGERRVRYVNEKPRRSKTFAIIMGTVVIVVVGTIVALIYFLFYYRAPGDGTF